MIRYEAACGCNTGKVRPKNEDNFCFDGIILRPENEGVKEALYLEKQIGDSFGVSLFDGMGGEAFGNEASYIAAGTFKEMTKDHNGLPKKILKDACYEANKRICAKAKEHGVSIMGSTMTALWISGNAATLLNLGDSPAFLLRDNKLRRISVEHTDRKRLNALGITNRKPRLTQHLGIEPSELVLEPAIWMQRIYPGDCFLLCSDGLTDMVEESEIADALAKFSGPSDCVDHLIKTALENGGRDNVTVIICQIKESL